ncbi:MAG TPA: glutamate mutase L, partial [Anaerolineae bacterium]|nr:glutamate mutase L [Anaerolineae bacterium]
MSVDYRSAESILALDCGSTTTKVSLIDRVGGEYRLVARFEVSSTVEPPWNDVTAAVRQAVAELSVIAGWSLIDAHGHIIMPEHQAGGVDVVVAVTSAAEPLRLLVAGVVRDVSLASARRALTTAYTVIDGVVSLDRRDGGRHVVNDDLEGQVRLIQELAPDAIVLVGGVDGGATRPVLQVAEAVAIACSTVGEGECPPVIYAGNAELREQVAEIMGAAGGLRAVDNVRPSLQIENPGPLQTEIEELFRFQKMERV